MSSASAIGEGSPVFTSRTGYESFRRLSEVREEGMGSRLWGGAPLLAGLSWQEFVAIALAAGAAALLIQGIQKFWENRVRPFGDMGELNEVALHGTAMTPERARVGAAALGEAFIRRLKERSNAYNEEYLNVLYTVDLPKEWGRTDELRHRLTETYVRATANDFLQFAHGLRLLSSRHWGNIYKEIFGEFLEKIGPALGPVSRWEYPPTEEDIANFGHFQKVLRREIEALELKIAAILGAEPV